MGKYTEEIGRTVGIVADAETPMANWTPAVEGRLKKIKIIVSGTAVTSLIFSGYIKLSSSTFGGVDEIIPFVGMPTYAATVAVGNLAIIEQECDLAITKTPIKVFYYYNVVPTTPELAIYGTIEG